MAPLLATLLSAGPSLIRLFGNAKGGTTERVTETIADVVDKIQGNPTPQNQAKLQALIDSLDPLEIQKLALGLQQIQLDREKAYLQDTQSARGMYQVHNVQADKIADRVMRWNLIFIFAVLLINVGTVYWLKDFGTILALIGNVLGWVLKGLFDERQQVCSFYFGSSMGSKQKDQKDPKVMQ
jgi:hypothetical protein